MLRLADLVDQNKTSQNLHDLRLYPWGNRFLATWTKLVRQHSGVSILGQSIIPLSVIDMLSRLCGQGHGYPRRDFTTLRGPAELLT